MRMYSFADEDGMLDDVRDEDTRADGPVDSFGRDVDTFEDDVTALDVDSFNESLHADVDSMRDVVALDVVAMTECASASAHTVSTRGIRDVSAFAFAMLRDANTSHVLASTRDDRKPAGCARCTAPHARCICPRATGR